MGVQKWSVDSKLVVRACVHECQGLLMLLARSQALPNPAGLIQLAAQGTVRTLLVKTLLNVIWPLALRINLRPLKVHQTGSAPREPRQEAQRSAAAAELSTCDILTEAKYSEKIRMSPAHGPTAAIMTLRQPSSRQLSRPRLWSPATR